MTMSWWTCPNCGNQIANASEPIRCSCRHVFGQHAVSERAARMRRLKQWLIFFRRQSDRGLGDTAERMFLQADERDIAQLLKRLLSSCNCRTEDAAEHLNKQHPYA